MRIRHVLNIASLAFFILAVLAVGFLPGVCYGDSPPTQQTIRTVLDAGMASDAEAAIAIVTKFLDLWDQSKYEEASSLVAEPKRKEFVDYLKKREIELQSIDDIRLFNREKVLVARVHASVAPSPDRKDLKKQELGIDMIFSDGKWWITSR